MFWRLAKRRYGQRCVFVIYSMVLIVCTVILSLVSLYDARSQDSQDVAFDMIQVHTQSPSMVTCPNCKPCNTIISIFEDGNNRRKGTQPDGRTVIPGRPTTYSPGTDDRTVIPGRPTTYSPGTAGIDVIKCSVPTGNDVTCVKRGEEVYMPVSFINPFFEVYGEMTGSDEYVKYQFQYSYGNLFQLQNPYSPGGVFNNFDHYNVEQRSKVLCVTASDGVPLTSQWKAEGYYYPITVAQYGLSHHAKAITFGVPEPRVLADGLDHNVGHWICPDKKCILEPQIFNMGGRHSESVLFFSYLSSMEQQQGPTLQIPRSKNSSLCLDIYFLNGTGEIIVTIVKKDGSLGYVHYDHRNRVWESKIESSHLYFGMSLENRSKWVRLVRDLAIDWNKAFSKSSIRSPTAFNHIANITLVGSGYLDNLTISTSHHLEHLIKAADWLVSNQDFKGGWPTDFEIKTGPIHLDPGWYSAMGQGQAMSTLVRAYNITRRQLYLDTAMKALHLFKISSSDGGVKTKFMDHLDWYEEYPTTPHGTFVLNGFIFSLLGLYDVMETVQGEGHIMAKELWDSGLRSLKRMLGMFDSGTGTFYDLRHVVYNDQPNRARWDYHMVHIQLVQQLAIIDGDLIFNTTALRWIQYSKGKRAKHN